MKSIFILFALMAWGITHAQENFPFPPLSPLGELTQQVGNTMVKIHYERPSARGRKIFGGLVPWNKVWRTGAGYSTKISFSEPVKLGGQSVPKGTFSLFTIPNSDRWMVILNKDTTLYGAYDYDPTMDVARFYTRPKSTHRYYEALTIDIDLIPNNALIYISWANTTIDFKLETSADKEAQAFIEELLLTEKDGNPENYASAADYLYFNDLDFMKAAKLAKISQQKAPNKLYAPSTKANIMEKLGYLEEAIEAIDEIIAITEKREYDQEKYRKRDIEQLQQRKKALETILERKE